MTLYRSPTRITSFEVPSFPATSAHRDRSEESRERQARMRDTGYQAGYAEGRAAGHAVAEHEVQQAIVHARHTAVRFDAAAAALEQAVHDLRARDEVSVAELEHEGMALGHGIARALIGRELRACERPVLDAMRRAARLVPDRGVPVVRVNPADEETVRTAALSDPGRWTAAVVVVADQSVEPGGCVVDVGPCRVDAQISTALDRMSATLSTLR